MPATTNEWDISTDIYDIVKSVDNLKRNYIPDQDETTLAMGIFGFISDTESKKIQTSIMMTGEYGNEMFPTRANLTKNVLVHAMYNNIQDINAVPARMVLNIGIKVTDFEKYAINNQFFIDCTQPIFLDEYEFHVDYDIVINRYEGDEEGEYLYSAHYLLEDKNRISNIVEPYLNQPFKIKIDNDYFIVFQTSVGQYTIEDTYDKLVSDSIIQNKTFVFTIADQLVDFDVYVTDNDTGIETRIQPFLYTSSTGNVENYCWYLYVNENTIRIMFDQKSYLPGLNCDIHIKAYTTMGSDGNFSYRKVDEYSEGMYLDLSSEKYNYKNISIYAVATTDSEHGTDRKDKEELQNLIPKAALSRGAITSETDVSNYFDMINTPENRLVMSKKNDNQLSRIWYGHFLLKDVENNIIPTNTIPIHVNTRLGYMVRNQDGRWVLPAGTIIKYNDTTRMGEVIDETDVPDIYDDDAYFGTDYYYMTIFNCILNPNPLYAAFYMSVIDRINFFVFNWVNESSRMQFVTTMNEFKRNLLSDQSLYKFTFKMAQSIKEDMGLYKTETYTEITSDGQEVQSTLITNNMKVIILLYNSANEPYRWKECELVDYDSSKYISSWKVDLETDNALDARNNLKILDLREYGSATNVNYGYFPPTAKAKIYTLAKFDTQYGRYDFDEIAPGYAPDYSVTNIYEVNGGLEFYESFTDILDTRVYGTDSRNDDFRITGIPVVGVHYMIDESAATFLVDAINDRKDYINYCLEILENTIGVDMKFFNTYGPSRTYSIGDKQQTMIGHVDLEFKFRASVKSSTDVYIKDELIAFIKEYIENLNDIGDFHAPNLITKITDTFSERINFVEFMNFNDFWLGVQHIMKLPETELEKEETDIVPEFLNVRNRHNVEGLLEPCIDMEIIL
jgi:hypothetical protein